MRNHLAPSIICALLLTGCASMTTPVLRHETGDTLGSGAYRVRGRLETSRVFPFAPSTVAAQGVAQDNGVFTGGLVGIEGAMGILNSLDGSLGAFFGVGGSGWRLGTKYKFLGSGAFSLAGMIGLGKYSGSGTAKLRTGTTGESSVTNTLSATVIDFGVPVSYAFTKETVVYSGLHFFKSSVKGSAATEVVSGSSTDYGPNIGLRFQVSQVEVDVEIMLLKVKDPFGGTSKMIPFFGVAGGIPF